MSFVKAVACAFLLAYAGCAEAALRSVVILRHCLRSTPTTVYGAKGFDDFDNYSSSAFPGWPVAAYECLPEGLKLIESVGTQLGPSLPLPLDVRVDTSAKRDNDTAVHLLRGMGHPEIFTPAPALFDPVGAGLCEAISKENKTVALKARIADFPAPEDHFARLKAIQKVLGKGEAPPIDQIRDYVSAQWFEGGTSVAAAFAEAFLMQLGGNMPVGWGRVTPKEVYDFLEAHIYLRGVQNRVLPLVAHTHTYMVQRIMAHLSNGTGTLVLVGHDGDLDALAALFGLSWHTPPFPRNATTPGSLLRFDVDQEGKVETTVAYQSFESDNAPGRLWSVGTGFSWTSSQAVTTADLRDWLVPRLDYSCVP